MARPCPVEFGSLSYTSPLLDTYLSYHDLNRNSVDGMPQLYANLSKNASIPSASGAALWADSVNKRLFLFGGEFFNELQTPFTNLLSYDILADNWVSFGPPNGPITGVSFGASVSIPERGEGYYYGGWLSNASTPDWKGPPQATSGLVRYSMDLNTWSNNTGPDDLGRAEGVLVHIPAGDGGLLVYFGGIVDLGNGTMVGQPMDTVFIYDVVNSKWYRQAVSGTTPNMRRRFCAGAAWPADWSSYNIYLYGGASVPGVPGAGFDDVYILSLPSFTWIKMFPLNSTSNANESSYYPHHSLTCSVVGGGSQMLIIGGTFPLTHDCDAPNVWGSHGLYLGKQNARRVPWDMFNPNLTSYQVPDEVFTVIGGGPDGGATRTVPVAGSFDAADLAVLMTRRATVAPRTPTRDVSRRNGSGKSQTGDGLSNGAIAGIAVGAAAVAVAMLLGCCCFFYRRRERLAGQGGGGPGTKDQHGTSQISSVPWGRHGSPDNNCHHHHHDCHGHSHELSPDDVRHGSFSQGSGAPGHWSPYSASSPGGQYPQVPGSSLAKYGSLRYPKSPVELSAGTPASSYGVGTPPYQQHHPPHHAQGQQQYQQLQKGLSNSPQTTPPPPMTSSPRPDLLSGTATPPHGTHHNPEFDMAGDVWVPQVSFVQLPPSASPQQQQLLQSGGGGEGVGGMGGGSGNGGGNTRPLHLERPLPQPFQPQSPATAAILAHHSQQQQHVQHPQLQYPTRPGNSRSGTPATTVSGRSTPYQHQHAHPFRGQPSTPPLPAPQPAAMLAALQQQASNLGRGPTTNPYGVTGGGVGAELGLGSGSDTSTTMVTTTTTMTTSTEAAAEWNPPPGRPRPTELRELSSSPRRDAASAAAGTENAMGNGSSTWRRGTFGGARGVGAEGPGYPPPLRQHNTYYHP